MFIKVLCNSFKCYAEFVTSNSDAYEHALLVVKNYFSDKLAIPFPALGLAAAREDLASLLIRPLQEIDLQNLQDGLYNSLSAFHTEKQTAFNEIVCVVMLDVPSSNVISRVPSTVADAYCYKSSMHQSSIFSSLSKPTPSPSLPPFQFQSRNYSRLFLPYAPRGTASTFINKAIQRIPKLCNQENNCLWYFNTCSLASSGRKNCTFCF